MCTPFPVIDPVATGENITRLRNARGLTVRDLQAYFGFEDPQAIYKWQRGQTLPSVDNLFALSALLQVPMDEILVPVGAHLNTASAERQDESCRSVRFSGPDGRKTVRQGGGSDFGITALRILQHVHLLPRVQFDEFVLHGSDWSLLIVDVVVAAVALAVILKI